MTDVLHEEITDAIVTDIVARLPEGLLKIYMSPPGRKPSADLMNISSLVHEIGSDKALMLIRDVMDTTIASVLGLIDLDFKDSKIRISAEKVLPDTSAEETEFADLYRYRVDPGGHVYTGG